MQSSMTGFIYTYLLIFNHFINRLGLGYNRLFAYRRIIMCCAEDICACTDFDTHNIMSHWLCNVVVGGPEAQCYCCLGLLTWLRWRWWWW